MHSSIPVIKRQGDGAAQDISAQRVATKMGSAPEDAILTAHQVPSYVVAARSQATQDSGVGIQSSVRIVPQS